MLFVQVLLGGPSTLFWIISWVDDPTDNAHSISGILKTIDIYLTYIDRDLRDKLSTDPDRSLVASCVGTKNP